MEQISELAQKSIFCRLNEGQVRWVALRPAMAALLAKVDVRLQRNPCFEQLLAETTSEK
jgi:hypothetical protein